MAKAYNTYQPCNNILSYWILTITYFNNYNTIIIKRL